MNWKIRIRSFNEMFALFKKRGVRRRFRYVVILLMSFYLKNKKNTDLAFKASLRNRIFIFLRFSVIRFVAVFRPTREYFTHIETSLLPMKNCKFSPILGTHDR